MRTIQPSRSLATYEDDLAFLEASLLAREATKGLAAPVTELLAEMDALRARWTALRRKHMQALARTRQADATLDEALEALYVDLFHEVKHDKSAPGFLAVFPTPLSEAIRHAIARQIQLVKKTLVALTRASVPEAVRDKHSVTLEAEVGRAEAQLASRVELEQQRRALSDEVAELKAEANAIRTSIYGALLGLGAKQKSPKKWADRCFLASAETPKSIEEDEPDEEPVTPS